MDSSTSDKDQTKTTLEDLQSQVDSLNQSLKKTVGNPSPSQVTAPPAVSLISIPQGPGSLLNADMVDAINANRKPMPNYLVPLDSNGLFPLSTIPMASGSGSGFLLGNGAPTLNHILVADGILWQSRSLSGDATINVSGVLSLIASGISAGTYGDVIDIPQITFDAKGRATSAVNIPITDPSVPTFTDYAFSGGFTPQGIMYDGTNLWTACGTGVSKVTLAGVITNYTIAGAVNINTLAFDGTNIWGCDNSTSSVFKISTAGTLLATYSTPGNGGVSIAFDGTNMWVTGSGGVTKVTPAGSTTLFSYSGGLNSIAFDNTNMWAADNAGGNVVKISPAGSFTVYSIVTGTGPYWIAFDGTNMWVTNLGNASVNKVLPSGSNTNYGSTGSSPRGIFFDGTNMWTTNYIGNSISKITPGGAITTYATNQTAPWKGVAVGSDLWIVELSGFVTKVTFSHTVTPGAVFYASALTLLASDPANFFWDKTNLRLGVGNNTPTKTVDITGTLGVSGNASFATIIAGLWNGTKIGLLYGGTNADLSGTGGTHQVLQQSSSGAAITVGQLAFSDISGTIASGQVSGSYTGITGVGTLTAGTWNATKIGLAYGGTNADLSATGGSHQVLQQSSSGANITVGQLSFADISGTIASGQVSGAYTGITGLGTLTSLMMGGDIQLFGDTTGAGTTVGFGTNSPATTLTAPYTWLKFISSDGSTVWVAAFK